MIIENVPSIPIPVRIESLAGGDTFFFDGELYVKFAVDRGKCAVGLKLRTGFESCLFLDQMVTPYPVKAVPA